MVVLPGCCCSDAVEHRAGATMLPIGVCGNSGLTTVQRWLASNLHLQTACGVASCKVSIPSGGFCPLASRWEREVPEAELVLFPLLPESSLRPPLRSTTTRARPI